MPLSSLVLTLEESPARRALACAELSKDERITLGTPQAERWLPLVAETASLSEGEQLVESLREVPGVSFVDVVMVEFSDVEGEC